jgi:hypothetical protein
MNSPVCTLCRVSLCNEEKQCEVLDDQLRTINECEGRCNCIKWVAADESRPVDLHVGGLSTESFDINLGDLNDLDSMLRGDA